MAEFVRWARVARFQRTGFPPDGFVFRKTLFRFRAADDLEGAAVGGFLVAIGEGERAGLVGFGVGFGEFALGVLVEEF